MLLTQCPRCAAIYRLGAATLSAAAGFVRCGNCQTVFNALYRLADEPAVTPPRVPATDAPLPAPASVAATETPDVSPDGPVPPIPAMSTVPDEAALPSVRHTPMHPHAPARDVHHAASRTTTHEDALDLDEVPAVLREDVARLLRKRRVGAPALWTLLLLLAVLVLFAQIAFETRSWWLARFPQAAPLATQLCARLGCELTSRPARTGIALVARDVREHPRYAHALLVNATLANRGDAVIAYPVIQLGVYDRNGSVVGVRRFAPREYLDASIDIGDGLRARSSVYVVLEIAGAGDAAESFEFKFL